jgi:DNA polymerase (family 10)
VFLEVNGSPERLDLPSHLIRSAKQLGCRFTISTDAHRPQALGNMRYGIATARRGWLRADDVLNTLPLEQFQAAVKRA